MVAGRDQGCLPRGRGKAACGRFLRASSESFSPMAPRIIAAGLSSLDDQSTADHGDLVNEPTRPDRRARE
jgi:hypothetical protein